MLNSIAALAVSVMTVAAATPTTRECVWEESGKVRITILYYQDGERYLRYNDVKVKILDHKGVVARAPGSGRDRYWYILARDSAGELVADDDYAPPVVSLSPMGAKAAPALPIGTRLLAVGAVLHERVYWDRSLLELQTWKLDERYRVRPGNGLHLRSAEGTNADIAPIFVDKCMIPAAQVVIGAAGLQGSELPP